MNKKIDDALVKAIMKKLEKKKMTIPTAATLLGITERQVYRIIKMHNSPPKIDKKKPRKSPNNKTAEEIIQRVIELYKTKYRGFSYIHYHEKLLQEEGIRINLKTLERILKKHYLISPFSTKATKRKYKKILQSNSQVSRQDIGQNLQVNDNINFDARDIHNRHRHVDDYGELLQLDARHDYYIEKEKWSLHLAIDVASGIFVGAYFDIEETLHAYQHVLHQIITNHGIPKCILTDNRTVFEYIRKNSNQETKNTLIQFKYSCIQLGIKLHTTSVATYKSIIERANGTFGRRVPQELRLLGITNIDDANIFLQQFLKEMNNKFSHPYLGKNVFRKAPDIETINNCIGSVARRTFDKGACVRYQNKYYYATVHNKIVAYAQGVKALVIRTFDNRMIIVVDSVAYKAICIDDYEFSKEKQANPESELFIERHRVNYRELNNYTKKHVSIWNYYAFEKYIEGELRFIESNY